VIPKPGYAGVGINVIQIMPHFYLLYI